MEGVHLVRFRARTRRRHRAAFTLVELLVVIAIIGILIALLLPAVQSAREAARALHCKGNFRQIGIALHNYHSAHRSFPPGGIGYGWCRNADPYGDAHIMNKNGLLLLLPHLEQQPLYDQFDQSQCACNAMEGNNGCCGPASAIGTLSGDAVNSGNYRVAITRLAVFSCPSDNGDPLLDTGMHYGIKSGTSHKGVKTNYDFSANRSYECNNWKRSASSPSRRMFGENSGTRIRDVKDGTSTTLAMGETLYDVYNGRCAAWAYRGWVMTGVDVGAAEFNLWERIPPPSGFERYPPEPRRGKLASWAYLGSLHPSGAHVMAADGSVHFFNQDMDTAVRTKLATMAGGEVASIPD
ncbi:MAG: DUF1559 domain-containing protein [Patescibacteria group bacterium]|nr:DUF1559 domain-containing protein [Patescibacteria group bacterium]